MLLIKNNAVKVVVLSLLLTGCASTPKHTAVVVNKPLEFAPKLDSTYSISENAIKLRIDGVPSISQSSNAVDQGSGFYANAAYSKIVHYTSYAYKAGTSLSSNRCVAFDIITRVRTYSEKNGDCQKMIAGLTKLPAKFSKINDVQVFHTDENVAGQGIRLVATYASNEVKKEYMTDKLMDVLGGKDINPVFEIPRYFIFLGSSLTELSARFATEVGKEAIRSSVNKPEMFGEKTDVLASVELVDDRDNLNRQKKEMDTLKLATSLKAYQDYLEKYPKTYFIEDFNGFRAKLVKGFFGFKLVDSYTGKEEDYFNKNLIMSTVGQCKKTTKIIEVFPVVDLSKLDGQNLTVTVNGTLKRDYRPYAINTAGDPIVLTQKIAMNPDNNYRLKATLDFGCVPVTWKSAAIGQGFLSRLAGAMGQKIPENITTTLRGTSLEVDITEVK